VRVLTVGNMYPPHSYGGYEAVWRAAVEHLRARGHEARVLTTDVRTAATGPDDPDVHRELRWHLREAEFDALGAAARTRIARHNHRVLRRHLSDLRPDAVAWWSMGGLTMTLLEDVRRRRIPAVAFVHDDWLAYGPGVDPWLRTFTGPRRGRVARAGELIARMPARVDFGAAARYVFVSEFTRARALGLGRGLDSAHTSVAHSGIHADFLRAAPVHEFGWRLLCVGRLDPRKGTDTAVEAMTRLPEQARLELIGGWDAREEARLRALAGELGVAERVEFAGHRERREIAAAYARCDVAVFPVRWEEPWGLVPLEAMAVGRTVVATGQGGSAEYLRDGENALLFPPGDAPALAAAVRHLADDEALRARLRAGGFAMAPRHTEQHLNEAVERALEAAVATGPLR
jgi:glycosyltransferase involved in cell wall biosynthesis